MINDHMAFASCNPPGLQLCIHCCSLHSSLHFPTGLFDPWWPCPQCLGGTAGRSMSHSWSKMCHAVSSWIWALLVLKILTQPTCQKRKTHGFGTWKCRGRPLNLWVKHLSFIFPTKIATNRSEVSNPPTRALAVCHHPSHLWSEASAVLWCLSGPATVPRCA